MAARMRGRIRLYGKPRVRLEIRNGESSFTSWIGSAGSVFSRETARPCTEEKDWEASYFRCTIVPFRSDDLVQRTSSAIVVDAARALAANS